MTEDDLKRSIVAHRQTLLVSAQRNVEECDRRVKEATRLLDLARLEVMDAEQSLRLAERICFGKQDGV